MALRQAVTLAALQKHLDDHWTADVLSFQGRPLLPRRITGT